ncbi:DUF4381 domain-containing protein [Rothia sp. AR01]|uniref:DUF4381 domain-containing protein n=1 Tax=Rothia santali TaxID=2949643 RepID=A0A9X2KHJ1_9MICC|nr:DUF4381 domain-containing protein [Rothia santali]MCP3425228.1 DUF4381 domain-containing protein [Rothia santali]
MSVTDQHQPTSQTTVRYSGVRIQLLLFGLYLVLAGIWLGLGLLHPSWWPLALGLAWVVIAAIQAGSLIMVWRRHRLHQRHDSSSTAACSTDAGYGWSPSKRGFVIGAVSMFLSTILPLTIATAGSVFFPPGIQAERNPLMGSWVSVGLALFAVLVFVGALCWVISAGFYLAGKTSRSKAP